MVGHAAGYQHDVVRRGQDGRPSLAERTVAELGRDGAFEVAFAQTRAEVLALTGADLRRFDAVLLFTTGDVPLRPDVRRELLAGVQAGRGLVGVHSATDTWDDSEEYAACLGGRFDGHPWHQRVGIVVEDSGHPATTSLASRLDIADEIYQFREWDRRQVHVLLRLDLASVNPGLGARADRDYALAWHRRCGSGRVFYTALGHRPEVWKDPRFQRHLQGGIRWALGLE
jgi:type 1 glutamine amidotransferase